MTTPRESESIKSRSLGQGQFRSRRDAEKAVVALRGLINVDVGTPQTICDLDAHYRAHELTRGRKSFSTTENHRLLCKRYIEPRWGHFRLSAIRTVEVEEWQHSLPLAPASKAKLKCVLSVLYNHAIRHEWLTFNPISRVRTSQKRLRDKDVLAPDEFQKLVQNLSVRDRAMVLLIGSTGLRRSEMIALTWSDLNLRTISQCSEILCPKPNRKDENRVVLPSRASSSCCAQRALGMEKAIAVCQRSGFSVPLHLAQRKDPSQPRQHFGEEHSACACQRRHRWQANRLA
jgi:site-specific recombinase XerD